MSKKHDDPRGKQKGPQQHAEGQHGERTHERFLEEIHAAGAEDRDDVEQRDHERALNHPDDGGHRLFENRHQNDPADRASDKNRRGNDIDSHGHDRGNFQVRGGTTSHPAMPDSDADLGNPGGHR